MEISEILKYISYRPKTTRKSENGCIFSEFRKFKNHIPSIELNGNHIYFNIIDMNGHKEGDVVSLDSNRRKCIIDADINDEKALISVTRNITNSLHNLYSGEFK